MKLQSLMLSLALFPYIVHGIDYPIQYIDSNSAVHFGQALAKVESVLGKKAFQNPSSIARSEKDYMIRLKDVVIEFDSGFLSGIRFLESFDSSAGVVVFKEDWKNFDEINGLRLSRGMQKEKILEYLKNWESRAKESGARKMNGLRLLRIGEYEIKIADDGLLDMILIGFGPERSTGKGGSWGDGASFAFTSQRTAILTGKEAGLLSGISVSCDDFNTKARNE